MVLDIRQLRSRQWAGLDGRKHRVAKVFPAIFPDKQAGPPAGDECELMMFGHVEEMTRDGRTITVPWAGHGVVKKVAEGDREDWKFERYQVWSQAP